MALVISCTGVIQRDGKWYVRFSDGTEWEFADIEQVRNKVTTFFEGAVDVPHHALLAWWLSRNPNGANWQTQLVDKTCTVNVALTNNIVRIT